MKLLFAGTRGEIDLRTSRHGMHSVLVASYRGRRVMIDCGADWTGRAAECRPHAIVITHAHPDHAWGLKAGAPCSVHATEESWQLMRNYPVERRQTIKPRHPFKIHGITLEAFPVEHSTRCPAVAYRLSAGRVAILYVPDVVYIHDRSDALSGVMLYVGDGASIRRPLVRRRGERLIGHAPIRTQLTWCQREGVRRAVFTHCGSEVVRDHAAAVKEVRRLAQERGVEASVACDGLELVLR